MIKFKEHIIKIVKDKFEKIPSKIQYEGKGVDNNVFSFKVGNKYYIIRFLGGRRKDKFENEVFALKQCRKKGIPVPKILIYDGSQRLVPITYMVENKVIGKSLSDVSRKNKMKLMPLFGKELAKVHEIKLKGFGFMKEGKGLYKNWQKFYYSNYRSAMAFIIKNKVLDKDKIKKIDNYVKNNKNLLIWKSSRLLHGDTNLDNVLISKNKITAIIDFSGVHAGDPMLDIGMFSYYMCKKRKYQKYMELFLKGYNKNIKNFKEKLNLYRLVTSLGKIRYRYKSRPKALPSAFKSLEISMNEIREKSR